MRIATVCQRYQELSWGLFPELCVRPLDLLRLRRPAGRTSLAKDIHKAIS